MSVFINNLNLQNFRNFEQKKISFNSKLVLFFGNNGVGKTNILEAISVLGRSSTLRGDDFEEMLRFNENSISNNFLISSQFNDHDYIDNMSVKFDKNLRKKIYQFNNEIATPKRLNELKNYLINFICLTPQIEQLFISGKSARRDYLDKIVCDLDLFHQNRLNDYQKLLKERLLILQKYRSQITVNKWLDIVENKIAEMGIAIAFARLEVIDFFNKAIESFNSNFPKAKLLVKGEVEDMAVHEKALNIENFYKQKLLMNRSKDLENFKTDFGVHRADFDALFLQKKSLATKSSTGEQKAIMISICLARAKILANYKNLPTIMIFDEIVSHLDEIKKHNLFDEINQTGLQCFFSATSSLALKNFQEISI
jgi:DNA replication and repair protein RecF